MRGPSSARRLGVRSGKEAGKRQSRGCRRGMERGTCESRHVGGLDGRRLMRWGVASRSRAFRRMRSVLGTGFVPRALLGVHVCVGSRVDSSGLLRCSWKAIVASGVEVGDIVLGSVGLVSAGAGISTTLPTASGSSCWLRWSLTHDDGWRINCSIAKSWGWRAEGIEIREGWLRH